MKSTIAKGALALSVLGFTFGSNVVYDQKQWSPSIFRTIANAVEFEAVTTENVVEELDSLKVMVADHKESRKTFSGKIDSEETSLSDLITLRDEELEELGTEGTKLLTRAGDFRSFFQDKEGSEEKTAFQELSKEMTDFYPAEMKENLNQKIAKAQETELLEQKAAIAATNEKLCENKGLLEDIKAQIADLLKDKEEVVAEVDEDAEETSSEDGFSTDVLTYADFFAHIQQQQRSFFEVSQPSFLAPANDQFSMMMLFSMMNNRPRYEAPRTQVNSYYMSGFGGFPAFGAQQPAERRDPATSAVESSVPTLMPVINGLEYTRVIPRNARGNGALGAFSIN